VVKSLITFKDSRRYPVEAGFVGTILENILVSTMVVMRIIFTTVALSNAPQLHPIGIVVQTLCVYIYTKYVLKEPASLQNIVVPCVSSVFHKPTKIGRNDTFLVIILKSYGGVLSTIVFETMTIFIYGLMGLAIRKLEFFSLSINNEALGFSTISPINLENVNATLRTSAGGKQFEYYIYEYPLGFMYGYALSFIVVYALLFGLYYKIGHP
jgi:hypothetical protein